MINRIINRLEVIILLCCLNLGADLMDGVVVVVVSHLNVVYEKHK